VALEVAPTPCGYSSNEEVITKLVAKGIPHEQIAVIGDARSDVRKQALSEVTSGVTLLLSCAVGHGDP